MQTSKMWLTGATVLLLSACATRPAMTVYGHTPNRPSASAPAQPAVPTTQPTAQASSAASPHAQDITVAAIGLVGTPYKYGGNTPQAGFDCSGLIAYVYRSAADIRTPRSVAQLQHWGRDVPPQQAATGDLVLFTPPNLAEATHAGIYVGEGRFVHAPSTGGEVRLDKISQKYWAAQKISYRRL